MYQNMYIYKIYKKIKFSPKYFFAFLETNTNKHK